MLQKIVKSLFSFKVELPDSKSALGQQSKEYFDQEYTALVIDCDRVFAILMVAQWIFAVGVSLWISPHTYIGTQSSTHYHVWLALFGGGLLALGPVVLFINQPGATINRYINVIAQGLFSSLLIHLFGGRIETHFHVFGSLAFFAFYRDLKVLLVGTAVVAADHLVRGIWFPLSVFGSTGVSQFRWLEHAAWVVFEDLFLAYSCYRSLYEMKVVAFKRAEVELQKQQVEHIVEIRTQELSTERNSMKLILDNIDQALFTVASDGQIIGQASSMTEFLFGSDYSKKALHEVLGLKDSSINDVLKLIFDETLAFESCAELLPQKVVVNSFLIKLNYKVVTINKKISSVLVIASDISEIERLHQETKNTEEKNKCLVKILSSKNDFLESVDMAKRIKDLGTNPIELKRQLHTLKGSFAFLECRWLADICHEAENSLKNGSDSLTDKNDRYYIDFAHKTYESLTKSIQQFLNENNHILKLNSDNQIVEIDLNRVSHMMTKVKTIDPSLKAVHEFDEILKVNLQDELSWLSDAYTQTAEVLGKKANPIEFIGSAQVPRRVYKNLFKSFIHIVRNSADHGLEDSATREMIGKNEAGNMTVSMKETDNFFEIIFKDDGAGVDVDKLKKKFSSEQTKNLSEDEIVNLIFTNGVSTKDVVSETSGRGVGLDAVLNEAQKLDGTCWAVNSLGEGLEIHVKFKKLRFSEVQLQEAA